MHTCVVGSRCGNLYGSNSYRVNSLTIQSDKVKSVSNLLRGDLIRISIRSVKFKFGHTQIRH